MEQDRNKAYFFIFNSLTISILLNLHKKENIITDVIGYFIYILQITLFYYFIFMCKHYKCIIKDIHKNIHGNNINKNNVNKNDMIIRAIDPNASIVSIL